MDGKKDKFRKERVNEDVAARTMTPSPLGTICATLSKFYLMQYLSSIYVQHTHTYVYTFKYIVDTTFGVFHPPPGQQS